MRRFDRNTAIDKLEAVHSFPGEYIFKVIGANSSEFTSKVAQVPINLMGRDTNIDIATQKSSGDSYISVTLFVEIDSAETVMDIYSVLQNLDEAHLIM